ncbi:hypothetical protein [Rhodospira trueperi]|jgi:hypothetical protein|uniref:Uncharacterized protein n=1 Tax=Rhodospira trueperi TaxID=69960 RepID=A0A1G7CKC2_9PROT|nr:hypothetical protein [Rhodospira trueperi]SDE39777.1 hypothetical protein SAMN05421720_106117 [Rhodospira trueperi]
MTDDPENLVLVYLRRMDTKLDSIVSDLADVKLRLNEMNHGFAAWQRIVVGHGEANARADTRMDRFEDRLTRIERRLDLVE